MADKDLVLVPQKYLKLLFQGFKKDVEENCETLSDRLESDRRLKRFILKNNLAKKEDANKDLSRYATWRRNKEVCKSLCDQFMGKEVYLQMVDHRTGGTKYVGYVLSGRPNIKGKTRTAVTLRSARGEVIIKPVNLIHPHLPQDFVYEAEINGYVSDVDALYYRKSREFDAAINKERKELGIPGTITTGGMVDDLEIGL